jgi:hypothetical protein
MMIPAHRHFEHSQSGALREKQKFDIETETINSPVFDNRAGGFHPKGFKAALGIGKGKLSR